MLQYINVLANLLYWEIILMNCAEILLEQTIFFQFIRQVTIEIRFRKSLAQERFKSNFELRNQIIVAFIKLRKGFGSAVAQC